MITRTFKLCLNAGTGSAPYINVNQYDEGETWLFELYTEQGERYLPTTGAIVGIKSDGHGIANTGTVDSNGRVVITETEQMTAAAGRAIFELSIDGLTHGTANFIVMVERKPTDDAIMSDSDYSMFQEVIDAAEVIEDVIGDGDPSEVIGEHVDAWLDEHPEATTTVLDGAITAPKINNSLWDKLLVNEEASGNPASFDDGADDVPVSSLKVALEPIQLGSGDPSPSNVRPIYPANSGNLFDPNSSGTEWVTSQNAVTTIDVSKSVRVPVVQGQALTLSNDTASSATNILLIAFLNSSNTVLSRTVKTNGDKYVTATAPANAVTAIASFYQWAQVSNAQLELGSVATSYQPYQGIMVEQTGRNLLPPFVVNASLEGGNATIVGTGDGAYTFNGTTTGYQQSLIQSNIHLKAGTYTFGVTVEASGTPVSIGLQLRNVSGGITYATAYWTSPSQTFTLAEDTAVRIRFVVQSALTFNNVIIKPQIELGNTATTYEPYQFTSYPYSLGQSVYGGTVDLATGVLTVTWGTIALDGSKTWQGTSSSGWYMNLYSLKKYKSKYVGAIYADKLVTGREQGAISGYYDISDAYPTQNWLYYYNNTFTSANEVKSYFQTNPTQIVYELATPTTIQLTPQEVKTLLGYNNISSSGTVDVIYHADTKLYVDKMTAVDNNIIAPTEADFVATRNYTVNDLVIVADTLYKVTANIATGSAITPNSNVTATTLSTLIKALS